MEKFRTIKTLVHADMLDMGGMPVRQAFPSAKAGQVDPFLLLHHARVKVPSHIPVHKAGVGPHPHRGFSPVTFIYEGGVHHRDSRGNNNVVYKGGTQWMNAGMGVIHSERPPAEIFELGGVQELVQLWVNSPASHKMDVPAYIPLTAEETPAVVSADGHVNIKIHSGILNGVKSPLTTLSAVNTFSVYMKKGGKHSFQIPVSHNAFLYLLNGKIDFAGEGEIEENFSATLNNDGEGFEITALADSVVFIGTGEPLNEPIASHGPFVMNTQTQIMEAFRDYEMGKMGVLIEEATTVLHQQ